MGHYVKLHRVMHSVYRSVFIGLFALWGCMLGACSASSATSASTTSTPDAMSDTVEASRQAEHGVDDRNTSDTTSVNNTPKESASQTASSAESSGVNSDTKPPKDASAKPDRDVAQNNEKDATDTVGLDNQAQTNTAQATDESEWETLEFVDVFRQPYETKINPAIATKPYIDSHFNHAGDLLYYDDEAYTSRLGVDVSYHQGGIDWGRVKDAGIDFAFIRIGYRGYGVEGLLWEDTMARINIMEAQAQGIDVGVYLFSQAINRDEAEEEARFVISFLEDFDLQLPVVYDPEHILDDAARTDDVPGEQFTENTLVFCEMVKEAGYVPAIYSNMLWEAFEFDLTALADYDIWYADYEPYPQTPYNFKWWQYTNVGYVDGIAGIVDMNVEMVPKELSDTYGG